MNDERILEIIENQDKYYVLGFIKGIQANTEELKERIEYLENSISRKEEQIIELQQERIPYTNKYVAKLETQQKKFIEWLENYLKLFDDKDAYEDGYYDCIEDILEKYKEIIGDDEDE